MEKYLKVTKSFFCDRLFLNRFLQKRNLLRGLISFICCVFFINVHAQYEHRYMPSPQTWDFMKYGNVPVSLYTGRLDLQIPIYHYQDVDFDINISLGYNSAGFIPNKPAGPVGLNWFLNCGGVITRRVVGVPDDACGFQGFGSPFIPNGILKYSKDNGTYIANNSIPGEQFFGHWILYNNMNGERYETTPDIFSFNFGKHRGSFIIDANGKVHVFDCENSGTYKIELSEMNIQPHQAHGFQTTIHESAIKITTGDGYIYEFGGNDEYVEYVFNYIYDDNTIDKYVRIEDPITITSWYLKSITAPNNRKVVFCYSDDLSDDQWISGFPPNDGKGNYIFTLIPYASKTLAYHGIGGQQIADYDHAYNSKLQVLKTVYLTKITIDNTLKVEFNYLPKEESDSHYPGHGVATIYGRKLKKLDEIIITDQLENENVDQITFSYQNLGPSNKKRMFLVEINNKRLEKYSFTYNKTNILPSTATNDIDFWGFWRESDNTTNFNNNFIPMFHLDSELNIIYTQMPTVRDPVTTNHDAGLLNKVVYPTGGRTEIIYEPHDYSKRLERRADNYFIPKLYTVSGNAGGARVKTLKDIDNTGTEQERKFIYEGGILMNWQNLVRLALFPNLSYIELHVFSHGISIDCYDDEYICYSSVTEKQTNNGYTKTFFSTFDSDPDDDFVVILSVPALNFVRGIYRTADSRKTERGKILEVIHFKENYDTVAVEKYSHKQIDISDNYILSKVISGDYAFEYRNYIHSPLLEKKTNKSYYFNNQNPVVTTETYNYNAQNQLSEIITQNSNGDSFITRFTYPKDFGSLSASVSGSSDKEIIATMQEKNILNKVIEEQNFIVKSGTLTELLTGGEIHRYKKKDGTTGIILPWEEYTLELSAPSNILTVSSLNPSNNMLTYHSGYKPTRIYDKYDSKGNLTQYHSENNNNTSVIWGYNGQYPIAKIENATYEEVKTALNLTENQIQALNPIANPANSDFTKLKNLRTQLPPQALLTIYTYKPLVGMTSQTDPNGITTYYEYDDTGRLSLIRDNKGNIIKSYQYHYQNETP